MIAELLAVFLQVLSKVLDRHRLYTHRHGVLTGRRVRAFDKVALIRKDERCE